MPHKILTIDTHANNVYNIQRMSFPNELFDAYEKYKTDDITFNKWIKTVSKYTTYYYTEKSYMTIHTYYTVKDNIVAIVSGRKIRL